MSSHGTPPAGEGRGATPPGSGEEHATFDTSVAHLARTGIPTANNTHEVAQAVAPGCGVVFVDNDPVVLAHARALLTSTPEGAGTRFLKDHPGDLTTARSQ